ncbi:MAG: hypothetical protein K6357_04050 [Elusimicrobiota bacterium]
MHFFNYTFTPFGIIIVLFAVIFSSPEKSDTISSLIILILQFLINYYFFKNIYQFKKPNIIRLSLVMFNIITTAIVFYFITAYWSPSWLLFTMPSAFAATFLNRKQTILIALISTASMFFVYWLRAYLLELEISTPTWTMALSNGLFIIVLSVFINNMSETIVKMRSNIR